MVSIEFVGEVGRTCTLDVNLACTPEIDDEFLAIGVWREPDLLVLSTTRGRGDS